MKIFRLFFLTCVMLLIAASAWANTPAVIEKNPVISIQEPIYTFEEVLDGQMVVHDYIVKNSGDAVLKIEKVDTT